MAEAMAEADFGEQVPCHSPRSRASPETDREINVLLGREKGDQVAGLQYHADPIGAQAGEVGFIEIVEVVAVDHDGPRVGTGETGEEAEEGGFIAKALGASIITEAEDLPELRGNVRDAVACHFEDAALRPKVIRLHFVRDEVIAA